MGEHQEGRVLRLDAKVCHVDLGDRVVLAAPRGALFEKLEGVKNPITVGDIVRIDPDGDPVHVHVSCTCHAFVMCVCVTCILS